MLCKNDIQTTTRGSLHCQIRPNVKFWVLRRAGPVRRGASSVPLRKVRESSYKSWSCNSLQTRSLIAGTARMCTLCKHTGSSPATIRSVRRRGEESYSTTESFNNSMLMAAACHLLGHLHFVTIMINIVWLQWNAECVCAWQTGLGFWCREVNRDMSCVSNPWQTEINCSVQRLSQEHTNMRHQRVST